MYSLKILQKQLSKLANQGIELGFYPVRSSIAMQEHLETLYDYEQKKQLRDLTKEEQDFIDNELMLSKLHAPYWLERYCWIKPSSGRPMRLVPNKTQQVLLMVLANMEERNIPLLVQLLKLRQLGCSTIVELLIAHRILFYSNIDGLVAGNDPDKTMKLLEQYIGFCFRNLPWWMCKELDDGGSLVIKTSGEVYAQFYNHNSAISWQHGTQTSGIARGANPQVFHVTELPDFSDPKTLVEGSMLNAIHEDEFTLGIFESTAARRDDWWHKFWKANEKLWASGKARVMPLFMPWYLGTDVWPPSGWVADRKQRGILNDYKPSNLTILHAERARKYVLSKDHLFSVLGLDWRMPIEQMAYWEFSREFAIEMDSVKEWLQEVGAADADECFQSGGTQIFPYELISEYKNNLPPIERIFYVEAEEINETLKIFTPEQRESFGEETISLEVNAGESVFKSKLIPLNRKFYPEMSPNGAVMVWELPRDGYEYSFIYDGAGGRGGDRVTMQVIRNATVYEKAKQVAEFNADNFTYHDAWPVALTLLQFYSKFYRDDIGVMAIIELQCNGDIVQDELQLRGWKNFYQRYSTQAKEKHFVGFGWNTSHSSRPKIIDSLIKCVKDKWLELSSPWAIQEIEDLERDDTKMSIRVAARAGSHDDRAITLGIAVVTTLGDIAPTAQNNVVKKLLANLKANNRSSAIKPSQVNNGGDNNLLSFGSSAIIAPDMDETFKDKGNLWN